MNIRASGRTLAICGLVFGIGAVLAGSDASRISASTNFLPTASISLSSNATSANADVTANITFPSGDMLGIVETMTPSEACVAPGPEASGAECGLPRPALGDIVGTASSTVTLGISNGACNFPQAVTVTLMNATVDNGAGNEISPSSPGEADPTGGPLAPLMHDVNTISTPPLDGDGGSEPPSAVSPLNGLPGHVDRYPKYLNEVFDPDGGGSALPLAPLARYSGGNTVFGQTVIVEVMVFSPGAMAAYTPPNPLADVADPNLGYVAVPVLNDPTPTEPMPNLITDLCTPLTTTTTLFGISRTNPCNGNTLPPCNGDSGINSPAAGLPTGRARYANPGTGGTYVFSGLFTSARDLDGDGIENSLDTCPYNANVDASPRVSSGPDADMLDSACDPGPGTTNNNEDADVWPGGAAWNNAADNCPLAANPTQDDSEGSEADNIARPRGGSGGDSLGDACDGAETSCGDALDNDAFPSGPEGLVNDGCATVDNGVGPPGAEVVCVANVDDDGDGFVNDGCAAVGGAEAAGAQCSNYVSDDDDNGDTTINSSDFINDGCATVGTDAEPGCLNSFDDDGDTVVNDGCASSAVISNGHFHTTYTLVPVCIGGTDGDGDGWCAAPLLLIDPLIDPDDGNAAKTPEHYALVRFFPVAHAGSGMLSNAPGVAHPGEPRQVCNDGIDNDGDTMIDLQEQDGLDGGIVGLWDCNPKGATLPTTDTDGDGYPDANEIYIGTDPLGRCERTGAGAGQSNDWPADHVGSATSGDRITLTDISTYTATPKRFNTKPGDANFLPRYDVNPGTTTPGVTQNWIVLTDLSNISSLIPSMFGVRALGGPTCAAHLTLND